MTNYRVVAKDGQFEPQGEGHIGVIVTGKPFWSPLDKDGEWAEPKSFAWGEVTVQSLMTQEEAYKSIWIALERQRKADELFSDPLYKMAWDIAVRSWTDPRWEGQAERVYKVLKVLQSTQSDLPTLFNMAVDKLFPDWEDRPRYGDPE